MVRYFKSILFFCGLILSLNVVTSCDNSDDIGDLLGLWKLKQVTYKGTTMSPDNLYIAFQSQNVSASPVADMSVHGHYTREGDMMNMKFYFSYNTYDDNPETDPHNAAKDLLPFFFFDNGTPRNEEDQRLGIYPVNLKFKVEHLDSSHMILVNEDGRWCFDKI